MGKRPILYRIRKPRFLRATAVIAWALQGLFMPWMQAPAHAANPDTMTLGVRARSLAPPAAITDLLASPNPSIAGQVSLTWTAPQGNAGGVPIPNLTVGSYTIHYATFSVSSLLGNTTSWWDATANQSATLDPPSYTPQSPGSLEAYTFTGLSPGVVYYFGIKSTSPSGIVSPIDIKSATPGQQAFALTSGGSVSSLAPQAPNGLLSTPTSNGLQLTLSWSHVTLDGFRDPVSIDHYLVLRYNAIGSSATAVMTVSGATTYAESTGGLLHFYRIQAVSTSGKLSPLSDYLDTAGNRYAIAGDDPSTRVVMPRDAALYLMAANNPYRQDLEVVLTRQAQNETNVTLRSYRAFGEIASTGEVLSQFAFPQNIISVQLGYGAILGSPTGPVTINQTSRVSVETLAQILSVFWFNGAGFVRVGDPVLIEGQAISVTVRNLGIYQIRAVTIGTKFRFTQGSPYPRVITPNGAENRRIFWFFDNPTGDDVTGTIYDIRGAYVRTLAVNGMSPTPNSLVWDGRDSRGSIVPSGVYLYKVSTSEATLTGTVVVAR